MVLKVYTVAQESRYLLAQGVPAIGLHKDLRNELEAFGAVEEYRVLDDYPAEPFTEVVLIKYARIQSARIAKRKMDNNNYCGGQLHICYAPEYETVEDTRAKLIDRRQSIARRLRQLAEEDKGKTASEHAVEAVEKAIDVSGKTRVDEANILHTLNAATNSKPVNYLVSHLQPPSIAAPLVMLPTFPHHPQLIYQHAIPPQLPPLLPPPPPLLMVEGTSGQTSGKQQAAVTFESIQPSRVGADTTDIVSSFNYASQSDAIKILPAQDTKVTSIPTTNLMLSGCVGNSNYRHDFVSNCGVNEDYLGSRVERIPRHNKSAPLIKNYTVAGTAPRFIPRQLVKCHTAVSSISADKSSVKPVSQFKDEVNEQLKKNALTVGSVQQGPAPLMSEDEERKRKLSQLSASEDKSFRKTVADIREKVSQFSSTMPPRAKKFRDS